MKKTITLLSLLAVVTFAAFNSSMMRSAVAEDGSVTLTDARGVIHNLQVQEIDGNRAVVDYIHSYYNIPEDETYYNDFMAGYHNQSMNDTCITWFTFVGETGTVLSMDMQNESSGEAQMFFAGPALIDVDGEWYWNMPKRYEEFTDMLMIPFAVPVTCNAHAAADQFDGFGVWDPRWNTLDLTEYGFEFEVSAADVSGHDLSYWGVPEIWAGYVTDDNGGPSIWQDSPSHLESEEGDCRSYSTLHATGLEGAWYRIWTDNEDWYAHMMQMTVQYSSVPPTFESLTTAPDGFDSGMDFEAVVTDLDGDVTEVSGYYYINDGDAVLLGTLGTAADDTYAFTIPNGVALVDDEVTYFAYAVDNDGLESFSPGRSFTIVAPPAGESVLYIASGDSNIDSLFATILGWQDGVATDTYYWNSDDRGGTPSDILGLSAWNVVVIAGWGSGDLFPMTAADAVDFPDVLGVASYVNDGGYLVFADQDYFWGHDDTATNMTFLPGDFAYDVFGIAGGYSDPDDDGDASNGGIGDMIHNGMAGNQFTGDFVDVTYGPIEYESWGWSNWGDYINANANAELILVGAETGNGSGVYNEYGAGATIYFGVNVELAPQSQVETLFGNILGVWNMECTPGDINDDGGLNVLDVLRAVNIILGTYTPDAQEECAADYNGDGGINVMDVVGIVQAILGGGKVSADAEATLNGNVLTLSGNVGGFQADATVVSSVTDDIASANGQTIVYSMNGKLETTTFVFSSTPENLIVSSSNGEEVQVVIANEFGLSQNYPNPFNPSTTIAYSLASDGEVMLSIYNVAGQKIVDLVNAPQTTGSYSVVWDGTSANGEMVSSGVYFYQINAGDFNDTKKMFFLK